MAAKILDNEKVLLNVLSFLYEPFDPRAGNYVRVCKRFHRALHLLPQHKLCQTLAGRVGGDGIVRRMVRIRRTVSTLLGGDVLKTSVDDAQSDSEIAEQMNELPHAVRIQMQQMCSKVIVEYQNSSFLSSEYDFTDCDYMDGRPVCHRWRRVTMTTPKGNLTLQYEERNLSMHGYSGAGEVGNIWDAIFVRGSGAVAQYLELKPMQYHLVYYACTGDFEQLCEHFVNVKFFKKLASLLDVGDWNVNRLLIFLSMVCTQSNCHFQQPEGCKTQAGDRALSQWTTYVMPNVETEEDKALLSASRQTLTETHYETRLAILYSLLDHCFSVLAYCPYTYFMATSAAPQAMTGPPGGEAHEGDGDEDADEFNQNWNDVNLSGYHSSVSYPGSNPYYYLASQNYSQPGGDAPWASYYQNEPEEGFDQDDQFRKADWGRGSRRGWGRRGRRSDRQDWYEDEDEGEEEDEDEESDDGWYGGRKGRRRGERRRGAGGKTRRWVQVGIRQEVPELELEPSTEDA